MDKLQDLLNEKKYSDVWKKHCDFLDYSLKDFLRVQSDLLLDQLDRLKTSVLGKKVFGNTFPKTVEEFRDTVNFSTYKTYSKFLMNKDESVLPEKPVAWAHTSGRSGEYEFKWAPYTEGMFRTSGEKSCTAILLSAAKRKGDVALSGGEKVLFTVATPPYVSGIWIQGAMDQFDMRLFPPYKDAIQMDFQERIKYGMKSALNEGLDIIFGMTSILVKLGEQIGNAERQKDKDRDSGSSLGTKTILRLLKAYMKAKLSRRNIIPKDIWNLKGIVCGGMDTSIYKNKVKELWGRMPLETYGSTEFGYMAVQPWNSEHMVFYPDTAFWEFIPVEEYHKMKSTASYTPKSLLMNELRENEEYVLAGTSYYGGVFARYIIGDLIKIVSLKDVDAGISLPQLVCTARVDDLIDIGGFTRLTEKIIWQAIENTGIDYVDWTVIKEYNESKSILHLLIELKNDSNTAKSIEDEIHESLKLIDEPYRELERMAGVKPLKVTLLTKGTFQRYYEERVASGADLAHLKPKHINPTESVLQGLQRMSAWKL
jgi:hypothetical protein